MQRREIIKFALVSVTKVIVVSLFGAVLMSGLYSSDLSSSAKSVTNEVLELNQKLRHPDLSTESVQTHMPKMQSGWPKSLSIPTVNISVDIARGDFVDGTWNVSEDTAHYATMTSLPNTFDGNTLIYAHNRPHLFQDTLFVQIADQVQIDTTNGLTFSYRYTNDEIVTPDNISIFLYKGPPRLTLLTCHGENDKYRRLLFFELVSVT